MRGGARLFAGAWALLLCGCFRYVPAELETVPAGGDVRVFLSRDAMAGLPEEVPLGEPYVMGKLMERGGDSLTLRIPVAVRTEGIHQVDISQDVLVPRTGVLDLQRRELNRGGTILAIAGAVGGATAVVALIMEASTPRGDEDVDPPDQIRIPLFSVSVP